jgi:hypothetical protein
MRVNYVTMADETMPAVRYRMLIPGRYIDGYLSKIPVDADLHVFTKPYTSDETVLKCTLAMAKQVDYVFDLCDDIFQRSGPVPGFLKEMVKGAKCVTTCTDVVAKSIEDETGVKPVVISDPTEFSQKKIKSIENPSVMWFGSISNFHVLKHVKCPYPVEIVCSKEAKPRLYKLKGFDYTFTEWSVEALEKAFARNNIVIVPTYNERSKFHNYLGKSPNRVVESIRNGLSVVAAPIPSYQRFSKWITLDWDIERGLKSVKQLTEEAQDYVEENHGYEVIGKQWENLFRSILGAEGAYSLTG